MLKKVTLLLLVICTFIYSQTVKNEEFRSTWVITWEYINAGSSVSANKQRIRAILDKHVAANMNAVLWQARQSGTAYYNSSYEPWGSYAGGSYPGFDPLQYAVEEAHKRGLELHAWFNVFHVASTVNGTIAQKHPEWICTNVDGDYMTSYRSASPGIKAVRDYTVDVAMELVRNYDIDGFHLDYVRWNEYDEDDMNPNAPMKEQISLLDGELIAKKEREGKSPRGTKRYYYDSEHPAADGVPDGFSSWDDWRRWTVTEFVKTLHDSIQSVKPWVRLSPAALGKHRNGGTNGWNGYYVVFQDAGKWFREGYIDQLTPMHYHWTSGSGFVSNLNSDWKPYIQEGIDAGRLYSVGPGSYILDQNDVWDNHEQVVAAVRTINWADGFQFFSYGSWDNHNYWDPASKKFFTQKTKVRSITDATLDFTVQLGLQKIDSLEYTITVTPPDTLSQDYWFAVYRGQNDTPDLNNDQIIKIVYGKEEFQYTDTFSDAYNYTGTYKYYATALNRYWHESAASNIEESDEVSVAMPLPLTPSFVSVKNIDETTFEVRCLNADFAEGYAVAYGTEPEQLTDTAKSVSNIVSVTGVNSNTPYYFKILSYNASGYSPASERLFASATSGAPVKVLVVNGFDRSTNTRLDYIKEYAFPITEYGYGFSYVLNDAVLDNLVTLTNYDIVIWFVGDESTADDTFNPVEQAQVKSFLKAGGKFFVSGAEIGWDLEGKSGHPSQADINFYNSYLKAKYVADAPGNVQGTYYTLAPEAGGIFDGIPDIDFDNGSHGTYDVDWPDVIEPQDGAATEFVFKGAPSPQHIGGISYKGMFPSGSEEGYLVHMTVPFETIYPEAARVTLMDKIIRFFNDNVSNVDDDLTNLTATDYQLYQNYPNPFNPTTKIRFAIPQANNVKLTVYNTLGQVVAELVNEYLNPGMHDVSFDASQLASGIYIYKIEAGNFTDIKKMMLVK